MVNYVISCIDKPEPRDPHTRIEGVGGFDSREGNWYFPIDVAIAMIERGEALFWTIHLKDEFPERIKVVVRSRNGRKHLRTESDIDLDDNLLSLKQCDETEVAVAKLARSWTNS